MKNHAPISPAKIRLVVSTSVGTLLVFYTNGHCWQFRVLSPDGGVFGEQRIFYTPEAAERAGREWVEKNSDRYIASPAVGAEGRSQSSP
jgi:hypothetical protein